MSEPTSPLDAFLYELKRRRVYRAAAAYAAVGFVLWQAAEIAVPALGLPAWVLTFVVVGTLVGFPVAVGLSWMFELRREGGQSARRQVSPGDLLADPALRRRLAVLLAAGAGVAAVTAAGIMLVRPGPATAAILQQGDRIVLADFQSTTDDDELAATITAAFRIDLAQSPFFGLVPSQWIASALRRMERDPTEPLTPETAREIAVRDGYAATFEGGVDAAGDGWIVSVQLVTPETGEILMSDRESVDAEADLIPAVDRLSARVRERIGESLADIESSPPLPTVTTGSLTALREFDLALQAFTGRGPGNARLHLEQAIVADSAFASAYGLLGANYRNNARFDEAWAYNSRAYELRESLPPGERLLIEGSHHELSLEWDQAAARFEAIIASYPSWEGPALLSLSAIEAQRDRLEVAESLLLRLRRLEPEFETGGYFNLVDVLLQLGRTDEALATADELHRVRGAVGPKLRALFQLGRYAEADSTFRAYVEATGSAGNRAGVNWHAALIELIHGRLGDFEARWTRRIDGMPDPQTRARAITGGLAWAQLHVLGDTAQALSTVAKAVWAVPADVLGESVQDHLALADFYAAVGDKALTREHLSRFDSLASPYQAHRNRRVVGLIEQRLLLGAGQTEAAIRGMQRVSALPERPFGCQTCDDLLRAAAYDQAGMADSAAVEYQAFVDSRNTFGDFRRQKALYLASSHERLAQLYEVLGDTANALVHHQAFVDLWQDADPDLQPRVEAARAALERLGGGEP